jgi:hypothetical protein
MATITGLPTTLEECIDYSMLAQAEGLQFGIEHYRRRKPHCPGTLIWQLNDCWQVLSWSIVDYYGFGKAGYFYTRRAYAAVMASFQKGNDGSVELWITITSSGEHEFHVHLHAVTYTYFLHLLVPDERTHFTDNYFDLEAGEKRTIILTNQSIPLTPDMVSVGWR